MSECLNIDLQELLPEYLAEQLDTVGDASVRLHLSECGACREELSLLMCVRGVQPLVPAMDVQRIGRALAAVAPVRGVSRVVAPVDHAPPPSIVAQRSRPLRASASGWRVAASFALLLAGGSSVYLIRTGEARVSVDSLQVVPTNGDDQSSGILGGLEGAPVADARVSISYGDLGDYSATELEQMLTRLEAWDGNTSPEPLPTLSMVSTHEGRDP